MVKFRHLLAALFICSLVTICAFAQSSLTQIRDTITNPDGTPFNGMVVITWNGYSVPSGTPVSELSASAQIYNGALSVLLVPTTTATAGTYYSVVYSSSNGTVSWTETWQVPPSTTALTLSQVRTSTTEGSTGTTTTTGTAQYATLPISISEVTSLSADLSSITSSIATLNTQIASLASSTSVATLQSTVTALSSTVSGLTSTVNGLTTTVNGLTTSVGTNTSSIATLTTSLASTSSTVSGLSTTLTSLSNTVAGLQSTIDNLSASGASALFVDGETPGGVVNGTNNSFTLANSPSPSASLALVRNGLLQSPGVDYTLSGMTITFLSVSTPQTGDILQASYRLPGTSSTTTNFVDAATPTGTINGTNLTFTLAYTPNPVSSVKLYKNGLLLSQASSGDYTISGSTITFNSTATTPQTGDTLVVSYRH